MLALPPIALPSVLDPAREAPIRELLRPKAKRLRDMTPAERRRVRPRPPSDLAAQVVMATWLRRFRAALQHQLLAHLMDIVPGLRKDAIDPHQYAIRFANLEVAVGELEPDLARDLRRTVVGLEEHTRGELRRVMRVSLEDIGLQREADEFVQDGVNLIRSVSFEQLGKMRQLVGAAASGQLSQRELAKQILERFDVTKSRARLIARDQVLKFNARASEALQRGAGVEGYFWSTSKDIRVRGRPGGKWPKGHHHQLEGTRQSWNAPPVVDLRTGRREHPGKDYQCRCVAIPDTEDLLYGGLEDEAPRAAPPVRAPLPRATPAPAAPRPPPAPRVPGQETMHAQLERAHADARAGMERRPDGRYQGEVPSAFTAAVVAQRDALAATFGLPARPLKKVIAIRDDDPFSAHAKGEMGWDGTMALRFDETVAQKVIVHEAIHSLGGASRSAYQGVAAFIEEASTEHLAHVYMRAKEVYHSGPATVSGLPTFKTGAQARALAKVFETGPLPVFDSHVDGQGSYTSHRRIVKAAIAIGKRVIDPEQVQKIFADAVVRWKQESYDDPDEAVRAFVEALRPASAGERTWYTEVLKRDWSRFTGQ